MSNIKPTKQAIALKEALERRGLSVVSEYWDKHKHVDLFIPQAKMYIEIDGLQHFTDAKQIVADLKRDHYSDDEGYSTKRFSNQLIDTHVEDIADAIAQIAKENQVN